jgi:hypothetical protein
MPTIVLELLPVRDRKWDGSPRGRLTRGFDRCQALEHQEQRWPSVCACVRSGTGTRDRQDHRRPSEQPLLGDLRGGGVVLRGDARAHRVLPEGARRQRIQEAVADHPGQMFGKVCLAASVQEAPAAAYWVR